MTVFRFRLQQLLRLRARMEQESAARAAEARLVADEARERAEVIDAAREAGMRHLANANSAGGSAGQVQQLALIVQQLEKHAEHADTASREAEEAVQLRLAELTAAAQERLALDKLRERRRLSWHLEQSQADQKHMDEIAITRFQLPNGGAA